MKWMLPALIGLIVAVALLTAGIAGRLHALATPDVSTVALEGDSGPIYFHCSGSFSSATLWISVDSTASRSDSDYELSDGVYSGLARTLGDTLEIVSQGGGAGFVPTRLPYHVTHDRLDVSSFGIAPNELLAGEPPTGYTAIDC
ncbi:MAG: hypothetical protein AAFQ43_12190 [Bacteroidota bacterium]